MQKSVRKLLEAGGEGQTLPKMEYILEANNFLEG
jgi:hypothetical protein